MSGRRTWCQQELIQHLRKIVTANQTSAAALDGEAFLLYAQAMQSETSRGRHKWLPAPGCCIPSHPRYTHPCCLAAVLCPAICCTLLLGVVALAGHEVDWEVVLLLLGHGVLGLVALVQHYHIVAVTQPLNNLLQPGVGTCRRQRRRQSAVLRASRVRSMLKCVADRKREKEQDRQRAGRRG